jgi:superfamily I DNA and/or RNA helicase
VFVTVRCNVYYELGFLADMRRLNVVMTRAKAGIVLIGHQNTLAGVEAGIVENESKLVWRRLLGQCEVVSLAARAESYRSKR